MQALRLGVVAMQPMLCHCIVSVWGLGVVINGSEREGGKEK